MELLGSTENAGINVQSLTKQGTEWKIKRIGKIKLKLVKIMGVGGAVRFLVVGTIGQEERPPQGQLWMEQCLTSLKYWPI